MTEMPDLSFSAVCKGQYQAGYEAAMKDFFAAMQYLRGLSAKPSRSDRQYLEKIADQVIARNSPETAIEQPKTHGSSPCIGPREGHRPATYGQLVTGGESAATGETGMVLGTGRERPLSIGLHTDGDPEARFETVSLHQNPKTDAAISRPGYPRPEIENRSSEEPCQARGSGEMQDEDAIHLPTFSKAETPREETPLSEAGSGAGVVSVCPALIDDVGGQ